jgi:hypothetical protein
MGILCVKLFAEAGALPFGTDVTPFHQYCQGVAEYSALAPDDQRGKINAVLQNSNLCDRSAPCGVPDEDISLVAGLASRLLAADPLARLTIQNGHDGRCAIHDGGETPVLGSEHPRPAQDILFAALQAGVINT